MVNFMTSFQRKVLIITDWHYLDAAKNKNNIWFGDQPTILEAQKARTV